MAMYSESCSGCGAIVHTGEGERVKRPCHRGRSHVGAGVGLQGNLKHLVGVGVHILQQVTVHLAIGVTLIRLGLWVASGRRVVSDHRRSQMARNESAPAEPRCISACG